MPQPFIIERLPSSDEVVSVIAKVKASVDRYNESVGSPVARYPNYVTVNGYKFSVRNYKGIEK